MGLVDRKIAMVTGSGAGIGRQTALKFAAEGAKVVVSDVNRKDGEETASQIRKSRGDAIFIRADVSKKADVENLIAKTIATYGRLDCAVNNAGILGSMANLVEQDDDNFDRIVDVNIKGVFYCMRAEIDAMLKTNGGAIVNLASIAGLIGFPGLAAYVASKHAVNGLTKNGALEYAKDGIRVNSICPGGINTDMLDSVADQATDGAQNSRQMMDPLHPMGRIGEPEETAAAIVWLCSPEASFVTGVHLPVDGGYVAA
ncbi:MAG: glucose 1-dehydrogenase [Acidimicrobiales bacterium]|nr:glucose 1-dehydrogenase [Hyphomonadaceae bacterium]RZV43617.1 MAG: glucose 1-dehydrogenase [Acidimicrobiales bacterium]